MSRPRVAVPSVAKYFDQPVKIFVGPEAKCYTIPKDLLCHYSQDHASPYFVACFDSGFQETQRGELRLIDENPEFFEVFLEYCRKGKATYKPVDRPEVLRPRKRVQLESCIEFIKFCDRYDLGQALEAIEGTLKKLFKDGASKHLDVASASHLATFLDKDGPIFRFGELLEEDNTVAAWMMRQLLAFKMDDEPREFSAFYCPELKNWKAGW